MQPSRQVSHLYNKKDMKLALTIFTACLSFGVAAQNTLAEIHFESDQVTSLLIEGSFCDVTVAKGNTTRVDGIITGDGDPEDFEFVKKLDGGALTIKVISNGSRNWSWNSDRTSRIDVKLPENVVLQVVNTSGDVVVEDFKAKSLDIRVTSGDVDLSSIVANLKHVSTSGDLVVEELSGAVTAQSTSGDQSFSHIVGNISTGATSGDLDFNDVDGDITAQATSGDIEIDGSEGAISVRTTSGDISGDDVTIVGDCRFKATSGDVEVALENDLSELSFDLTASSGSLRVGGDRESKRLIKKGGNYEVKGVTTSGSQYFYQ